MKKKLFTRVHKQPSSLPQDLPILSAAAITKAHPPSLVQVIGARKNRWDRISFGTSSLGTDWHQLIPKIMLTKKNEKANIWASQGQLAFFLHDMRKFDQLRLNGMISYPTKCYHQMPGSQKSENLPHWNWVWSSDSCFFAGKLTACAENDEEVVAQNGLIGSDQRAFHEPKRGGHLYSNMTETFHLFCDK